uniref:Glucose 1-dehydrogenase n=1 Tax=Kalmanozyma brasiliensis (strain GHG001) TaxID=1365824 RepID=V5GNP1_KALBG
MSTTSSSQDDALPTSEQLSAANAAYVLDNQGNQVDFSSIQDQAKAKQLPLVLIFTRHFHCGMCKEYVRAVAASNILTDPSRVLTVIVGPGEASGLTAYRNSVNNPPFTFYADPQLRLYHALGVTRRNLSTGDPSKEKIGSHHTGSYTQNLFSSIGEILKSGTQALKGGDFKQLGGEFVWNQEAGIIVHYLGDAATTTEAQSLQTELAQLGAEAVLVPGDISDAAVGQSIADAAEKEFGRLDVFVSNAGICPFMGFLEMEAATWRKVQDVNLNGAFFATQAAARLMSRQSPRGGSIIAIASISALVGGEFQSHYTPTKAGLKSMMESAAIGLGPLGIRCNSVLPGTIETAINEEDLRDEAKRERMVNRHPLRRLGRPDDIAGPVLFLASDLAKFMTGSSVLVDGGCFVNLQ